jgi:hypothetical protein
LNKDAGGHSVRNRIDWLIANKGQSEQEACSTGEDSLFLYQWLAEGSKKNNTIAIFLKFVVVNSLMFAAANVILTNASKVYPSVAALHAQLQF